MLTTDARISREFQKKSQEHYNVRTFEFHSNQLARYSKNSQSRKINWTLIILETSSIESTVPIVTLAIMVKLTER